MRQFREIFTEEGRRQVKITHQVPGRAPVVTYTQVSNVDAMSATKSTSSGLASQPTTSTAQVDSCLILRYHHCSHILAFMYLYLLLYLYLFVTNVALWLP